MNEDEKLILDETCPKLGQTLSWKEIENIPSELILVFD